MFRENLVKGPALGEVFSSLASVALEQERKRVFEKYIHITHEKGKI